jgi:rsbT antagonist protein RsbS
VASVGIEKIPILKNKGVLIVSVHDGLDDMELNKLSLNLLSTVSSNKITGVVVDLSALQSMDLFTARSLSKLVAMVSLMDVKSVLVGMKPAVAITLTEMNVSFPDIATALSLERGLDLLQAVPT